MPDAYLSPFLTPALMSSLPKRSRCLIRRQRLPWVSPFLTGRNSAPVSPLLTQTTAWACPQEPWRGVACHESPRRVRAVSPRKDAS
jgi:hypothetical protein